MSRLLPALVACVPLLMLAPGCSKHGPATPHGGGNLHPSKVVLQRPVELTRVEQRSLVYRAETVGVLEAESQTDIAAGVGGLVDEVVFREGDEVRAGTLLAKIDQQRYEADDALANANLERAKANMDLARDLLDRAMRAGQASTEEERVRLRGQMRVADAEQRAAVAGVMRARHNLERSRVRAPYPGRINKRLVAKGSYVEEKTVIATIADLSKIRLVGYIPETSAPIVREMLGSQPLRLDLARLGLLMQVPSPLGAAWPTLVNSQLVERDYIPSGNDPEFELLASPGIVLNARIFYMSTVASPDTHMFESKAEVLGWSPEAVDVGPPPKLPAPADPQEPLPKTPPTSTLLPKRDRPQAPPVRFPMKLWPGYTARIRFPLRSHPNACVVPEEAVRASERGFICFVPTPQKREDGVVEWIARPRVLELGFRSEGRVEVRSGLTAGEWIVRRGAEALEDGTPIRFKGGPK